MIPEIKYTQGQWNFVANENGEGEIGVGYFDTSEQGFSDYTIATTYGFADPEEGISNARLIACAPELLQATLELALAIQIAIDSGDWKIDGAYDPTLALERAKNLVTKAIGNCE